MDTMPFGKHKGTRIADLPAGYIIWMFEQGTLRNPLKAALEYERNRRGGDGALRDAAAGEQRGHQRNGARSQSRSSAPAPARSSAGQAYRDLADGLEKAAKAARRIAELAE